MERRLPYQNEALELLQGHDQHPKTLQRNAFQPLDPFLVVGATLRKVRKTLFLLTFCLVLEP
jgi:hypothetical protein